MAEVDEVAGRKMGGADDGAEVRSALGKHNEVDEGRKAKGFFFEPGFYLDF